jgi:hypothetical protein
LPYGRLAPRCAVRHRLPLSAAGQAWLLQQGLLHTFAKPIVICLSGNIII